MSVASIGFYQYLIIRKRKKRAGEEKKSIQHGRVYYVCLCGGASLMMSIGVCVALIKLARWMGGGTPQFIIIEVIEQIVRRRELTSYDFFLYRRLRFFYQYSNHADARQHGVRVDSI